MKFMHHNDTMAARPTQRLGNQVIEADGDTWQETLAVCEAPAAAGGKLIIRSYYQNVRNGKRVWDEPPSGATNILPASEEMRKMAEMQLSDLHVVTTKSAVEQRVAQTKEDNKKKKKIGFRLAWKKKEKKPTEERKIRYKPGSNMLSNRQGADDSELQEAIARSLAESQGLPHSPSTNYASAIGQQETSALPEDDDDELAMAKALSLSTAQISGETEDEILARVLEESRLEGGKTQTDNDLLGLQGGATQSSQAREASRTWNDDRKLPASTSNYDASYKKSPTETIGLGHEATASSAYATGASRSKAAAISSSFDPYARTGGSSTDVSSLKAPPTAATGQTLQKMNGSGSASTARLGGSFGKRRVSSKKMQDQAGLV